MPRERAKLTDKQERILVQAQLMGLTPRDMQQIGNRLIALQKEAEDKKHISENIEGYSWAQVKGGWQVTTPDGHTVEAIRGDRGRSHYHYSQWEYDFKVSKPGTRFKTRTYKQKSLNIDYDWKKRLMPADSKELYAVIRWIRNNHYEWC